MKLRWGAALALLIALACAAVGVGAYRGWSQERAAVEETYAGLTEMLEAREVFVTGATTICLPVVSVDGKTIANGHPGMTAQKIREAFFAVAEKTAI